jgi:hypothetical protein
MIHNGKTNIENLKFDVFISYRRSNDVALARLIYEKLTNRGINCFLDLEEERSGEFNETLLTAIRNSENFLLLLSHGSLERCVNHNDWVRKEIHEAIKEEKNIIPVLTAFHWDKELSSELPHEIINLKYRQSINHYNDYFSELIEKIIIYCDNLNKDFKKECVNNDLLPKKTEEFFKSAVSSLEKFNRVDMAFHAGADWFSSDSLLDILSDLLEKKIRIRILLNTPESAEILGQHMRRPLKKYVQFSEAIEEWKKKSEIYPDLVEVRTSSTPLLRRYYFIRQDDGKGVCNIKYYTYGNYKTSADFRACFSNCDDYYRLYFKEYEYLWERAASPTIKNE